MTTMTHSGKARVELPTETQILITREFDAPRHLVYRAYTEPDLVKRWWSGERGEVTSVEADVREGGTWRYVMTANEGFEVAFHGDVPRDRPGRAHRLDGAVRGRPGRHRGRRDREHDDVHRGRRAHDADDARGVPHRRGARHDHRLGHGGRHAGGDGPPRAGGPLARLIDRRPESSQRAIGEVVPRWPVRSFLSSER